MTGSSDYKSTPSWEFYDLQKDPKENHNAYGEKEYESVIREMKKGNDALARRGERYG